MNSSPFLVLGASRRDFRPTDIGAGVKLWLRADLGVTQSAGLVSAWNDQTTNANHATEATNKPTFVASGLNSLPTIRFVGPTVLSGSSNIVASGAARTTFIVFSNQQGGVSFVNVFVYRVGTPNFSIAWDVGTSVYTDGVNAGTNEAIPAETFVQSAVYETGWDGNSTHLLTVKLNGSSRTTSSLGGPTAGPSSDTGTAGYQIHDSATPSGWGGDISEIVCCDGTVSAGDLFQIRHYLGARYGLAIS